MGVEVIILMVEAIVMYLLVLGAHSLRRRSGPVHFYALLGGITAIMSWVTDAGLSVSVGNITFVVGSTVFYTSLLLGVFVVYVFDGPKATRIAISTVMAVSILMPFIAAVLRFQMGFSDAPGLVAIPSPSLRINTASVIVTFLDLIFLAIAWEFLGKPGFHLDLWFRTWLTLLGVMWVDVLLFATGAFAGTPQYMSIMQGTLVSRFIISLFSLPFLYGYLHWQSKKEGQTLKKRPVLAILKQVAEMEAELSLAQREIKRRKKAEEALRESERKLRNIVEHSTNLFYSHTPDHKLTYLSPQAGTFFGLEPEDAGIRWMELATDNPVNEIGFAHTERAIKTGKASPPYELELYGQEGRKMWVEVHEAPIVENGKTVAIVGSLTDITARKEMEERLRQQKRLAAVGQLAAGIAHDFRNLLGTVLLYAHMAQRQAKDSPTLERNLDTIIDEAKQATELVQQMLDFGSRAMIKPQAVDLAALVGAVSDTLKHTLPEEIDLVVDVEKPRETEFMIQADPGRIRQALTNLALNARDAMPKGGELRFAISRVDSESDDRPPVSTMGPGPWISLAVEDTGMGMTQEVQEHLFEPFFTTKEVGKGSGLGLAQVYGIVQQHKGYIDVESEPGKGTRFRIYLPARTDQIVAAKASAQSTDGTILVIAQDEKRQKTRQAELETLGYNLITAKSGHEALAHCQSSRWSSSGPPRVDLVLTELELSGMGAKEILRELRNTRPDLRVLALTQATLSEDDIEALKALGFADVILSSQEADGIWLRKIRQVLEA